MILAVRRSVASVEDLARRPIGVLIRNRFVTDCLAEHTDSGSAVSLGRSRICFVSQRASRPERAAGPSPLSSEILRFCPPKRLSFFSPPILLSLPSLEDWMNPFSFGSFVSRLLQQFFVPQSFMLRKARLRQSRSKSQSARDA